MRYSRVLSMLLAAIIVAASVLVPSNSDTIYKNTAKVNASTEHTAAKSYASSVPVLAPESDFTYIVRNEKVFVQKYNGTETQIIIPAEIEGFPVYSLTSTSFGSNKKITYVKIPSSLKIVSALAFNFCDELITIDVDSANTAFTSVDGVLYSKDMTKLVTFPGGRSGAFTVPKGVTSIGSYAFDHCYELTSVKMYNSVTDIGASAFSYCWSMASIKLSDRLLTLGASALSHCDKLKQIHLPGTLTAIGQDAVLGRISSDGFREYYFNEGIYCVKGTYSADYVTKLGLKYDTEYRAVADIDTGVSVVDINNKLPADTEIIVKKLSYSSVSDVLGSKRYNKAYIYNVTLTSAGKAFTPTSNVLVVFKGLDSGTIVSATQIYRCTAASAVKMTHPPQDPLVYAQTKTLGTFAVLSNNDFSLKGDGDGDGVVTLYDARLALAAAAGLFKLTSAQLAACNVDGKDSKVTTADARLILRRAIGVIAPF